MKENRETKRQMKGQVEWGWLVDWLVGEGINTGEISAFCTLMSVIQERRNMP